MRVYTLDIDTERFLENLYIYIASITTTDQHQFSINYTML